MPVLVNLLRKYDENIWTFSFAQRKRLECVHSRWNCLQLCNYCHSWTIRSRSTSDNTLPFSILLKPVCSLKLPLSKMTVVCMCVNVCACIQKYIIRLITCLTNCGAIRWHAIIKLPQEAIECINKDTCSGCRCHGYWLIKIVIKSRRSIGPSRGNGLCNECS